jgi:hypothetical protein
VNRHRSAAEDSIANILIGPAQDLVAVVSFGSRGDEACLRSDRIAADTRRWPFPTITVALEGGRHLPWGHAARFASGAPPVEREMMQCDGCDT